MAIKDDLREKLRKGLDNNDPSHLSGRQQVILYKQEIVEALEDNFTRKEIWELLREQKKITISYQMFIRYLNPEKGGNKQKNKSNQDLTIENNTESKNNNPIDKKQKRKPIYNPPEEKKGFVHNPVARKDLY